MYQGNLKVVVDGDIVIYDFGIMGEIDEYICCVYVEILMGFICRDYMCVVLVYFEVGYVLCDCDMVEFVWVLCGVGELIFGVDVSCISMVNLLVYLFEVIECFGMVICIELILLQCIMVVVEGVVWFIDFQINMWEVVWFVVESYICDNLGFKVVVCDLGCLVQVLVCFVLFLFEFFECWMFELLCEILFVFVLLWCCGLVMGLLLGVGISFLGMVVGVWLGQFGLKCLSVLWFCYNVGFMWILYFGDVMGCVGWCVIMDGFLLLKQWLGVDFIVVNGENVLGGMGLMVGYVKLLLEVGVDCIMLGDYVFD